MERADNSKKVFLRTHRSNTGLSSWLEEGRGSCGVGEGGILVKILGEQSPLLHRVISYNVCSGSGVSIRKTRLLNHT